MYSGETPEYSSQDKVIQMNQLDATLIY